MHKLKSIKILGFRGQAKPVKLHFDDKASFIVGRNGTGKTTLINLINAALAVDFFGLREARFDEIEIKLKEFKGRKITTILIKKTVFEDLGIEYTYDIKTSASHDVFQLNTASRRAPASRRPGAPATVVIVRQLRLELSKIFKSTWLSLQRGMDRVEQSEQEFPDEDMPTAVDRKLEQVLTELVKYFSRLDSLVAEQTQLFQKRWFLSFLATERTPNVNSMRKIDMEEERSAIVAIFEKFNLNKESYGADLDRHLALAGKASAGIVGDKMTFKDFFVLYDVLRLHSLVEQWGELQETQKKIYLPKTDFVEIASDMLFRKTVSINRSNQVTVTSLDGNVIPSKKLSSGEKQILIFLSETLLQEQEPCLFLADEPELSLHIEWQEDLVPNILRINPNAQIIFATHSPDVVNKFQSGIIMMEELIE